MAVFIFWSGAKAAKETIDPLLGVPPTHEFVSRIRELVMAHTEIIGIHDLIVHDFRMVSGPTHTNVIFDAVVPYDFRLSDKAVEENIRTAVWALDGSYRAVVCVERSYT